MQLESVPAIVTGGASGLGEASARWLAEAGAKVAIWDRDREAGAAVAREIGGRHFDTDIGDPESVDRACAATRDAQGISRVLVHCAGIPLGEKTLSFRGPHSIESFERVIRVNLLGTFYCCRAVAADLSKAEPTEDGERGVLITTASIAATEGQVGQVAYAASKAGVMGMTLPMARDLAKHGIRCVTITPGLFKTAMAEGQSEKVVESLSRLMQFPQRFGKPDEFASLVLEICRNPMINGETLRLDGAVRLNAR